MATVYQYPSCIRGYHVYQSVWTPVLDEILVCDREIANRHDPFAIKVLKSGAIVGHLPKKISSICSLFIRRGGSISCRVTGKRRYSCDLIQGGMEIPCLLLFEGKDKLLMDKVSKLLTFCESTVINTVSVDSSSNGVSMKEVNPPKKLKIDIDLTGSRDLVNFIDTSSDSQWLFSSSSNIKLTTEDKAIIVEGLQLNDKHIDYAQGILSASFPEIEGLRSVLIQKRLKLDIEKEVVQILFIQGNHWIVMSNFQCEQGSVNIYDSLYSDVDDETRRLVNFIFDREVSIHSVQHVPKQKGGTDCGIFAIAFATALLNKNHFNITQSSLRSHLITCFESHVLTPFP